MNSPTKRIAAIHDLSGFGRTSLMVVIPIFSTMGIEVCPLPTAVLSTHTSGFENFRFVDLTAAMHDFLQHWQELSLKFDAIYSGFLGSPDQVDIVAKCIDSCLTPNGLVVVDPVLGDNGELDPTMTPEMVERMRWLVSKANCITPNFTEAALLLNEPFPHLGDKGLSTPELKDWLVRLSHMGPESVVITSAPLGSSHASVAIAYQRHERKFWKVHYDYVPAFYPGTGDTFASVLTASLMMGDSLPMAMDRAAQFVTLGIRAAFGHNTPHREGIFLERALPSLNAPLTQLSYTLWEDTK